MFLTIKNALVPFIPYKKKIKQLIARIKHPHRKAETEFFKRMEKRHSVFWTDADSNLIAHTPVDDHVNQSGFKNVKYWQRKLSNKFNSRVFANIHNCRIPDLYWNGRDIQELNFGLLPESYVIRPSKGHSCKSIFLMDNGINLMDKKGYSTDEIKSALQELINQDPQILILVEEFIKTETGEIRIPNDYKFYTFNGEIACVQLINRYGAHDGATTWYDENWKQLENINSLYKEGKPEEAPRCFEQMKEQARILSKSYELFVRIDFYASDKGPVFGEFTPTPGRGKSFTKYGSDLFIGYWDKYCINI